jgi:hypothetical protein
LVLKKRSKKLLIIGLVAVTVVWFIALYLHIQDYNRYIQDTMDHYLAIGLDEDFIRDYICFFPIPIYAWGYGPVLTTSALSISATWIILIISTLQHMLKVHKHNDKCILVSSKMKKNTTQHF